MTGIKNLIKETVSNFTAPVISVGELNYTAGNLQSMYEKPGMLEGRVSKEDLETFVENSAELLKQYDANPHHQNMIIEDVTYAQALLDEYEMCKDADFDGITYEP